MTESITSTITSIRDMITRRWKNEAGQLHREDGPAVVYPDGTKAWYQNGKLHREDGPAIEYENERKEWYQKGTLHRLNGPAIERPNGEKTWFQNGKLHCADGPAIICNDGTTAWYYNDKLLGKNLKGFWNLWEILNEEDRQNVNLHMWLRKLTND